MPVTTKAPTLVLHFNRFNGQLLGGYFLRNGRKSGPHMTATQVLTLMLANPDMRCDPLKV